CSSSTGARRRSGALAVAAIGSCSRSRTTATTRWPRPCSSLPMRLLHLASVTTGAVILYGCAAEPVRLTPGAPPGYIAPRPGKPGFFIAAPHGTSDLRTGDIATDLEIGRASCREGV